MDTPEPQISLYLLRSEPQIRINEEVIPLTRKDALHLLIYLADQDRSEFERERLAKLLFSDKNTSMRMRDALFLLIRFLEENGLDRFINGQDILEIDRNRVWVDTRAFAQRVKILSAQLNPESPPTLARDAEAALALYHDHFLADYSFATEALRSWHDQRQDSLALARHKLLERVIQFHLCQGSIDTAQHFAEIWQQSLNPDFNPLRYLLWIVIRKRQFVEVRHYLGLLKAFEEDDPLFFGAEVEKWLSLVESEVDPPLSLLGLSTAKVESTAFTIDREFVGREDQLPDLASVLTRVNAPAVTGLIGLPGVGKTLFAQQILELIRHTEPDFSVAWVKLSWDTDFELLLDQVLTQFQLHHVKTLSYIKKQTRFIQLMQVKPCLVIVDEDVSQRLSDPEFLQSLVAMFKGVRLLLIARQIHGEDYYPIELLGFDAGVTRQFLSARVPTLNDLPEDNFATLRAITGGLPLALGWVVGFLRDNRFQLKSFVQAMSALHRVNWSYENALAYYEYILNWLWQQLLPDEKNLLYTISMFDSAVGAALEDIAAIADVAFVLPAGRLEQKLARIVDLNLLHIQSQPDAPTRYALHPIPYAYIQKQPHNSFQVAAIQRAFIERILAFISRHQNDFSLLDQHKFNILKMFEVVLLKEEETRLQQDIVVALNQIYRYLERCGLYRVAEQFLTRALAVSEIPDSQRVELLYHLGQAAFKQGHSQVAELWFKQASDLAETSGQALAFSTVMRDLGNVYIQMGAAEKAIAYLERGRRYAQEHGQFILEGQIVSNLGVVAADVQGFFDIAQSYFEQVIAKLQTADEPIKQSYDFHDLQQFCETMLGAIATRKSDFQKAEMHLQRSLNLARELNNPERIARVCLNLAALRYSQREFEDALKYLIQGSVVAEFIQHSELQTWLMWNKGAVQVILGQYKSARRQLQDALNQAEALSINGALPMIYVWFGVLHYSQMNFAASQQSFSRILPMTDINAFFAALGLYGFSLASCANSDGVITRGEATAIATQIATALATAQAKPENFAVVDEGKLREAESYLQVALSDTPGLQNLGIVEALMAWKANGSQ